MTSRKVGADKVACAVGGDKGEVKAIEHAAESPKLIDPKGKRVQHERTDSTACQGLLQCLLFECLCKHADGVAIVSTRLSTHIMPSIDAFHQPTGVFPQSYDGTSTSQITH